MSKKARDAKWFRRYLARLDRQAVDFARRTITPVTDGVGTVYVVTGAGTFEATSPDGSILVVGVDWARK